MTSAGAPKKLSAYFAPEMRQLRLGGRVLHARDAAGVRRGPRHGGLEPAARAPALEAGLDVREGLTLRLDEAGVAALLGPRRREIEVAVVVPAALDVDLERRRAARHVAGPRRGMEGRAASHERRERRRDGESDGARAHRGIVSPARGRVHGGDRLREALLDEILEAAARHGAHDLP